MGLPKIDKPVFELVLPSTGKKIKYTPFTVKEEKILLIAQESKDVEQSILSMKQIVNNCLVDIKVEDLSMFDMEYVLLLLRSKSVDNTVAFTIKDPDTEERVELTFDLDEVEVSVDERHTKEIRLDDTYVLYMRYPTIDEFLMMIKGGVNDSDTSFDIMISCMDKLVSEEEVFKFSDFTSEEIEAFMDSLEADVIKKMKFFFDSMPKMRHTIKYNDKTGKEKTFVVEGTETFFI